MKKTQEMRAVEDYFGRDIRDLLFEYRWGARPRTLEQIAEQIGVHPGTVWNWCEQLGLNIKQVAWSAMREESRRLQVLHGEAAQERAE